MEKPEKCVLIDLGDSVALTVPRAVGHTQHRICAPLSGVLRTMRGIGWHIVATRSDGAGSLRVYLEHMAEDEPDAQTVCRLRTPTDKATPCAEVDANRPAIDSPALLPADATSDLK